MIIEAHGIECEACGNDHLENLDIFGMEFERCGDCGMYVRVDLACSIFPFEPPRPTATCRELAVQLARLSAYVTAPAPTMLELGCGQGDMLLMAEQHGWNAHGIEPVDTYRRRCVSRANRAGPDAR